MQHFMSVKVALFQPLSTACHGLCQQIKWAKKTQKSNWENSIHRDAVQRWDYFVKRLHFMLMATVVWYKKNSRKRCTSWCWVLPIITKLQGFYRFSVSYSRGNKRKSSLANFPPCLSQVGFPHWTQGQARTLSRFCVLWFKVWSVLSDTALWANMMSSYGIQMIQIFEMSDIFSKPPSRWSFFLFNLPTSPSVKSGDTPISSTPTPSLFAPIFSFPGQNL